MAQKKSSDELAYALVTPYSLHKSRTGGILARLLWANVKLVAARMYAPRPGSDFIEKYCDAIYDPHEQRVPLRYQRLLIEYIVKNFCRPNVRGISNRLALLLFRGPNAQEEIADAVGRLTPHVRGDDVRGTYGEFFRENLKTWREAPQYAEQRTLLEKYEALKDVPMQVRHNDFFEPAALTGRTPEMNKKHLKLFREHAYSDGGFVLDALDVDDEQNETSMVILKPESFRHRNPLPGNLIDFFARTGMFITAMRMYELDVDKAQEFYGLKVPQFRRQLKGMVAERAREIVETARAVSQQAVERLEAPAAAAADPQSALEATRHIEELFAGEPQPGQVKPNVLRRIYEELSSRLDDLAPPESLYEEVAEHLKEANARAEFNELIRYMTGRDPETHEKLEPSEETRCLAILYSGPDALQVIRKRLKELRAIYGTNVLQNRAHASDPEEDPVRERQVLGMPAAPGGETGPCDVKALVDEFYGAE